MRISQDNTNWRNKNHSFDDDDPNDIMTMLWPKKFLDFWIGTSFKHECECESVCVINSPRYSQIQSSRPPQCVILDP